MLFSWASLTTTHWNRGSIEVKEDLLEKNNSVFINHNNLQALAIGKKNYTKKLSALGARKL